MRLTEKEKMELAAYLKVYEADKRVRQMDHYIQHGSVTTLDHCRNVARLSCWINHRLKLGADEEALAVSSLLHDFYLYDWHEEDDGSHRLHGFTHAKAASANAKKYFGVSDKEQKIIESHMWPLTLRAVPSSREAVILCISDKVCSGWETLFMRTKATPICE